MNSLYKGIGMMYLILISGFFAKAQDGFYNQSTIQDIQILFDDDNWSDVLDSLCLSGGGMMLADVMINGDTFENCGINYRSTLSFRPGNDRNPIQIKLNYIDQKQNHEGYKAISLSNALRDPSMVREVVSYDIAGKYMAAPEANYARLKINDLPKGIYVNVEVVDEVFLEKHFGSSSNTLIRCTPGQNPDDVDKKCRKNVYCSLQPEVSPACFMTNYQLLSDGGWDMLMKLIDIINNKPDMVESIVNVDQVLWMHAFNNALVNLNSYSGQNSQHYYLYQDDHGRFTTIPTNLNLSFGSFKNTGKGSDLSLKELQKLDPMLHADNITKPLISALLNNPTYKKIYLSHLRTINNDNFRNGDYKELVETNRALIANDLMADKNWYYSYTQFSKSLEETIGTRSKIPGVYELMDKRARFLKKNKMTGTIPPKVDSYTVRKRKPLDKSEVTNYNLSVKIDKFPKAARVYYRFSPDDAYQSTALSDDGRNGDRKANDGIYRVTIEPAENTSSMEYYIWAENAVIGDYFPANYMKEPLMVSLKELNQ